jgi:hypothetical protein
VDILYNSQDNEKIFFQENYFRENGAFRTVLRTANIFPVAQNIKILFLGGGAQNAYEFVEI